MDVVEMVLGGQVNKANRQLFVKRAAKAMALHKEKTAALN